MEISGPTVLLQDIVQATQILEATLLLERERHEQLRLLSIITEGNIRGHISRRAYKFVLDLPREDQES
jgi:hypothetical protein